MDLKMKVAANEFSVGQLIIYFPWLVCKEHAININ